MKFAKDLNYSSYIRGDLVEMLPIIKGNILEVDCGTGATLEYLKARGASYVVGIDINVNSIEMRPLNFAKFKGLLESVCFLGLRNRPPDG